MKTNWRTKSSIGTRGFAAAMTLLSLLFCLDVAAQEPRPSGHPVVPAAPRADDGSRTRTRRLTLFPNKPARFGDVDALRSTAGTTALPPIENIYVRKPKTAIELPLPMPKETANALNFQSSAHDYWRPRTTSAFPSTASPSMFPASRLRGPFEQTYPRPLPGGGQP